jgi:hypothetical protein
VPDQAEKRRGHSGTRGICRSGRPGGTRPSIVRHAAPCIGQRSPAAHRARRGLSSLFQRIARMARRVRPLSTPDRRLPAHGCRPELWFSPMRPAGRTNSVRATADLTFQRGLRKYAATTVVGLRGAPPPAFVVRSAGPSGRTIWGRCWQRTTVAGERRAVAIWAAGTARVIECWPLSSGQSGLPGLGEIGRPEVLIAVGWRAG